MRGIIILMMAFIRKNWAVKCDSEFNRHVDWGGTRGMGILGILRKGNSCYVSNIIYNPHRMRRVWPQRDGHKRPPASLADEPTRSHAGFIWRRLVTRVRLALLVTMDLLPLGGFRSAAGPRMVTATAAPRLLHYRPPGVTNPINWF